MLDFGLAKLAADPEGKPGPDDATRTSLDATTPGSVMGTVSYMSPEQALGKPLDARTDVFSLGVVLYEMITGRRAFAGDTSAAVFDAILNRAPTAPVELNTQVPDELERIVNKALEKDPALRYQSAADLLADLRRLRRDSTTIRTAARGCRARRVASAWLDRSSGSRHRAIGGRRCLGDTQGRRRRQRRGTGRHAVHRDWPQDRRAAVRQRRRRP